MQDISLNDPNDPLLREFLNSRIVSARFAGATCIAFALLSYYGLGLTEQIFAVCVFYGFAWQVEVLLLKRRIARGRFGDHPRDHEWLDRYLTASGKKIVGLDLL